MNISPPKEHEPLVDDGLRISKTYWRDWFFRLHKIVSALVENGTSRPTAQLYVGRVYLDHSLGPNGHPVWIGKDGLNWVNGAPNHQYGSGTTRPTTGLYAGLMWFDENLSTAGKPIWRDKLNTGWVDATGTAV